MATLPALILNLRSLGNDTTTSNCIREEVPNGETNTVNRDFRLQNWPLVPGLTFLTIGTSLGFGSGPYGGIPFGGATGGIVFRTQAGFTTDDPNGLVNIAVPPPQDIKPFIFDYNFYWFADTEYTEFINRAAESLGIADPTQVPVGLTPSLLQYALCYYWMRRSSQYAHKYSSTGGMAGHQVESVTKNFQSLADKACDKAIVLRDSFYEKQGRRKDPASSTGITYSIDPYTPRR